MKLILILVLSVFCSTVCKTIGSKTSKEKIWSDYQGELDLNDAKKKCAAIEMRIPFWSEIDLAFKEGKTKNWEKDWNKTKTSFYWIAKDQYNAASFFDIKSGLHSDAYFNSKFTAHLRCVKE
jgi:hypothetical protein